MAEVEGGDCAGGEEGLHVLHLLIFVGDIGRRRGRAGVVCGEREVVEGGAEGDVNVGEAGEGSG